jgi:hypothetical protein
MKLTFMTDLGQTFVVEIDPEMELENVMALLEAEVRDQNYLTSPALRTDLSSFQSSIPIAEQSISYEDRELGNPKATIRQLGVEGEDATLLLRRRVANIAGRCVCLLRPASGLHSICIAQAHGAGYGDDAAADPWRPRAHASASGGTSLEHPSMFIPLHLIIEIDPPRNGCRSAVRSTALCRTIKTHEGEAVQR